MTNNKVAISVHWNGRVVTHNNNPRYIGGRKKLIGIPMDITFREFERKMYRLTDIRRDEHRLGIKVRCLTGENHYDVYEVTDDDSLFGMMALSRSCACLIIYIEKQMVVSQGYSRMLNSDLYVDVLSSGAERETFRVNIGGRANTSREYEVPNVAVGPSLPLTTAHTMTSSSHARLGGEQGNIYEERIPTSHNGHDFGSFPLETEFDGLQNQPAVQQKVDEEQNNTDHKGVEHESPNLAINDDVIEEGQYLDADHGSRFPILANSMYTEVDDPIANNEYVDDSDEGAEFIDHPEQFIEDDEWMGQFVVNNIEFDHPQIEQGPPSIAGLWVGRIFHDKSSLLHALEEWHIAHNVQMKILKSTTKVYTVRCTVGSCPWRLHASVPKDASYFRVKTYAGQHTCLVPALNTIHQNCTSSFIWQRILLLLRCKPTLTPTEIKEKVFSELHVVIPYSKAWQARNRALQIIYDGWEQSYANLDRYLSVLQHANPGTQWRLDPKTLPNGVRQFERVFWAFGPSIHGFAYCRPLLSIDGAHMYGKYQGHALIATGVDANNGLYLLAFAICEGENASSWRWFLRHLKALVTRDRSICLISDCLLGLKEIVAEEFPRSEGHAHRWCLRHLKANMKKAGFKNENVLGKFYTDIGCAATAREYYEHKDQLRDLDSAAWLWVHELHEEREYWARAFDGGRRFGLMTTNRSESLNGVLKGVRGLPIMAFVATTFYKMNSYFVERREKSETYSTVLVPKQEAEVRNAMIIARGHLVRRLGLNKFEVNTGDVLYEVILNERCSTCSCREFELTRLPCSHLLAACSNGPMNIDYHSLCSEWYTSEYYRGAYAPHFHPFPDKRSWPRPQGPPLQPPPIRRKKGRPRSTRIRNAMDER